MRGGSGIKNILFFHKQGIKTVHAGRGEDQKWQNSIQVVFQCPLILQFGCKVTHRELEQLQYSICYVLILAIAPFVITNQRAQAVSYSHSLSTIHDRVAIKNPTDTMNIGAYTEPLNLWSWICIGVFCVVCPPFLYFTTR